MGNGSPLTKRQGILSLGEARSRAGDQALASVLGEDCSARALRDAALSGLGGREYAFLNRLLGEPGWAEERAGAAELLQALSRCVIREGAADRIEGLFHLLASATSQGWQFEAITAGILAGRRKGPKGELMPLRLLRAPLNSLDSLPADLVEQLCWPGRSGCESYEVRPMSQAENLAFERGSQLFRDVCAGCHRPSGLGNPGLAPQLRDQAYVLGEEGILIRILTHGLQGPITVEGHHFDAEMPATGFSAEDLAAVATYIRREWGHGAEPVTPDAVRKTQLAEQDRGRPWTVSELEALELE